MRMLIKKLLKSHRYPPEGMEDAVQTVMTQCELWTDNNDMDRTISDKQSYVTYGSDAINKPLMAAEPSASYKK